MNRAAPAGTEVGLYVDLFASVELGDVIETRSGRRYLVSSVRVQERGKHTGRQHLRAVVLADMEMPELVKLCGAEAKLHRIAWYARRGRGGGSKGRIR